MIKMDAKDEQNLFQQSLFQKKKNKNHHTFAIQTLQ